jgi:hypothetical protein
MCFAFVRRETFVGETTSSSFFPFAHDRASQRNAFSRRGGARAMPTSQATKPISRKRREAERRKAHHPWPHRRMRQRAERSALALRRSTAALASAIERLGSAQAALHANGACRRLPARHRPIALKRSTSRAGHSAGGDDAWTARERGHKPRPQEPQSPATPLLG